MYVHIHCHTPCHLISPNNGTYVRWWFYKLPSVIDPKNYIPLLKANHYPHICGKNGINKPLIDNYLKNIATQ